ncbi:MAG: hypothetical protein JXQ99_27195 [Hyphomicrobiaceae bacterium]
MLRSCLHGISKPIQITSVEGLTLLILVYGSIGGEVARKAKAFDMKVIAMNRTAPARMPPTKSGP